MAPFHVIALDATTPTEPSRETSGEGVSLSLYARLARRHSSAVEQLFRKQQVLSSNLSVGSTSKHRIALFWAASCRGVPPCTARYSGRYVQTSASGPRVGAWFRVQPSTATPFALAALPAHGRATSSLHSATRWVGGGLDRGEAGRCPRWACSARHLQLLSRPRLRSRRQSIIGSCERTTASEAAQSYSSWRRKASQATATRPAMRTTDAIVGPTTSTPAWPRARPRAGSPRPVGR